MRRESIVLIPTYNERENVAQMIDAICSLPSAPDILIIDDNSPDGTAYIVKEKQIVYPNNLHLLERQVKDGLGRAYIAGFEWALEKGYKYIVEMDCDFSHPVDKLPELIECVKSGRADVSVGSRYTRGGRVRNWPLKRLALSYGASLYVRIITGLPIKDSTAGFVCYNREVLDCIDLSTIRFRGYAFQIEMKYATYSLGFRIREIPITFEDRILGNSKMSSSIFGEGFFGVWELRWHKLWGKFPIGRKQN